MGPCRTSQAACLRTQSWSQVSIPLSCLSLHSLGDLIPSKDGFKFHLHFYMLALPLCWVLESSLPSPGGLHLEVSRASLSQHVQHRIQDSLMPLVPMKCPYPNKGSTIHQAVQAENLQSSSNFSPTSHLTHQKKRLDSLLSNASDLIISIPWIL